MSNPHPHAALVLQYAQDAAETDKPWLRWECRAPGGAWISLWNNPNWDIGTEYIRKPKTIKVNGFDVPEPLDKVEVGTPIYIASPGSLNLYVYTAFTVGHDIYLNRKIIHATKEAAVAHAKAMLGIDPQSP